jgi:DNA-directed RNA polymerase specialized sigma24 family protein
MDIAKTRLIEAATALRRTIYRALPWGLRLGGLLFNLRFGADARSFGQLTYGLFHLYGVNGLPRTPFVPETLREIDGLPDGYGAEFGQKARRVAAKYFGETDQVDEVLSLAALKLLSNKSVEQSVRGKDVNQAENYVLRLVQNQALDMLRSEKVRRHEEISDIIEDPKSWQNLGELIPPREIDRLRGELERAVSPTLAPEIALYFDLLLDGYSNKQIAEDRLLPSLKTKPMTQQALAKYRSKIKDVLRGHYNV